jgi:hypothetical protein
MANAREIHRWCRSVIVRSARGRCRRLTKPSPQPPESTNMASPGLLWRIAKHVATSIAKGRAASIRQQTVKPKAAKAIGGSNIQACMVGDIAYDLVGQLTTAARRRNVVG